jgi:gamma-glutamyltranspeptidase / glutathione hydrolase
VRGKFWAAGSGAACAAALVATGGGAQAAGPRSLPQQPVAYGTGGGAATMSPYATAAAIQVLEGGGNAVDAAVAAASTLGVTEPFVAGPGGGGFFVYYRAKDKKVFTIDGREKAPSAATPSLFLDDQGKPMDFETAVESGKSVGVPGNVATWGVALKRFGTEPLATVLAPAQRVARKGFKLDAALVRAIGKNQAKLARFPASAKIFLPGGKVPRQGYRLRNPDLASTYRDIVKHGWRWFYTGPIAAKLARTTRNPQTAAGKGVAGGAMTAADMRKYTAPLRKPLSWTYRGYKLYGMAPPSSGGSTIGEAMNILENFKLSGDRDTALYRYIEALKLAFADRGKYVGDTDFVKVPLKGLLSKAFAKQRAALIGPTATPYAQVAAGDPWAFNGGGGGSAAAYQTASGPEGQHTNHLVVADRHGNVVSYTNTIEQIAGSGITVPGRGFLLNNELTDFTFATGTANSVQGNKRPRSSMSPTIVTRGGKVVEAIGSPGGSTIITTVLQTLLNQIDFGMSLPEAIEEPRASQTAGPTTSAEPALIAEYGEDLGAKGEDLVPSADPYIGIAAGLAFLPGGRLQTATEAWRGGGGSAMVVRPRNPVPSAVAARALPSAG